MAAKKSTKPSKDTIQPLSKKQASKVIKKEPKSKKQREAEIMPEAKDLIPARQSNIFVQRGRKREQDQSYINRILEKIKEQKAYIDSLKSKKNS